MTTDRSLVGVLDVMVLAAAFTLVAGCQQTPESPLLPDDYQSWVQRAPTVELDYPVPGHENHYRIMYGNDLSSHFTSTTSSGEGGISYPPGTVIIKEIYEGLERPAEGAVPITLTAMIKRPEDNRNFGGWLWVAQDVASGKETVLDHDYCVKCHSNANELHPYGDRNRSGEFRDFVFFPAATP